ncbi:MAG: adenylate/guanylate cyclase domain-containing protein [Rhodospirillales bacterium]|nr:adenylate/guanylate cyclase domain-containing protein [Rhodospirillales bacterium]
MLEAVSTSNELETPPWHENPIVEWLLAEAWNITDPVILTESLGAYLVEFGFPLYRLRINIRTLHPQVVATGYTWMKSTGKAEIFSAPHSILQTSAYQDSPFAAFFENNAGGIRRRLDVPGLPMDYPILKELQEEGATDYVAMPIYFSDGKINAITFAADRAGGFSTRELEQLYGMLPILSRLLEVHALRRTAETLLETYLGKHSGARVLDGLVKRGDGEDIHAVIWFCDLRDSTPLADSMPRAEFLLLLNRFFECMAGAVLDHNGEVLRFIGDAVLAIFPISAPEEDEEDRCKSPESACRSAVAAVRDAMARMNEYNRERKEQGESPLGYGIGLHVGDLTYGNIGAPERLEFTVIGAAANEAARLEGLCKTLKKPILASGEFVRMSSDAWASLGEHSFRGVREKQEIFTLSDPEITPNITEEKTGEPR